MRTLNELYTILLHYSEEKGFNGEGICNNIAGLRKTNVITYQEWYKLYSHFHKQKPLSNTFLFWGGRHSKFTKSASWNDGSIDWSGYWWCRNKKGNIERIKFLKYLSEQKWPTT